MSEQVCEVISIFFYPEGYCEVKFIVGNKSKQKRYEYLIKDTFIGKRIKRIQYLKPFTALNLAKKNGQLI